MLGGQGDDSMRGIYWSDASRSDKCRYNCRCAAAIQDALLKDTLDMAYEITKLIKKSPKRGRIPQKITEFLGQMERDFHVYDMDSPTLKILYPTGWTVQAAAQVTQAAVK